VAKAAGEEWRTLTAEEREKYEEMSAQSKVCAVLVSHRRAMAFEY
jgi:hypothetical protein